jgi:hypothetical protein
MHEEFDLFQCILDNCQHGLPKIGDANRIEKHDWPPLALKTENQFGNRRNDNSSELRGNSKRQRFK